jgi:hypothetical protein
MADRQRAASTQEAPSLERRIKEYRSKLRIDKEHLDDMLVEQPESFDHVGEALALARAERDALKLDLKVAEAEAGKRIRAAALKHNQSAEDKKDEIKITEGYIEEELTLDKDVRALRRELGEASADVEILEALKESFIQRSHSLRDLVPMYLSRMGNNGGYNPRDKIHEHTKARLDEARGGRTRRD